jgi:hypothetical protein
MRERKGVSCLIPEEINPYCFLSLGISDTPLTNLAAICHHHDEIKEIKAWQVSCRAIPPFPAVPQLAIIFIFTIFII